MVAVIVAAGAALSGCTDAEKSTATTTSSSSTVGPVSTAATAPQNVVAQAKPFPTPPYIEPTPVDVGSVTNIDKVQLTNAQKEAIARQGFVATGDLGG